MKWSEIRFWGILFGFLLGALPLLAQDALPEKSRPDRHSGHVSDSEAMQQLMRFVEVSNPMPAGFKGTTENTIIDPIYSPEDAMKCIFLGAHSVVVGSAITRPHLITKRFTDLLTGYQNNWREAERSKH